MLVFGAVPLEISIHAPREGSDPLCPRRLTPTRTYFYPRSPRGERPVRKICAADGGHFYPRSPRGERPHRGRGRGRGQDFYPRSPRGERPATGDGAPLFCARYFYPRSPRGERPTALNRFALKPPSFLSTLPARGATPGPHFLQVLALISIHAPREGSDRWSRNSGGQCQISIHAPREGSDGPPAGPPAGMQTISIHAPREGSDKLHGII